MDVIVLKGAGNWKSSRRPSEGTERCTEGRVEIAELISVRSVAAVIVRLGKARLLSPRAQVPYLVRECSVLRQYKGGKKGNTRNASKHQAISIG
jgi:hypothetical protein